MALRLPAIQRRPVQDLAKGDPMTPVRTANARANALSKLSQVGEQGSRMFEQYRNRERQESIREANLAVHKADANFRRLYEGKEEYDVMKIDDENFMAVADSIEHEDPTRPVPAHQVYAEWRRRNYEDAVTEASTLISDQDARDRFVQEQDAQKTTIYANDSVKSTKEQIKYITKKTMAEVETSLLNKDYPGARIAIKGSDMGADRQEAALNYVTKREQGDYFEEMIEKRPNVAAMNQALDYLVNNDPKYTSRLNAKEQGDFANQLRVAISVEGNAISAGVTAQLKLQRKDLRNQIKDTWDNKTINTRSMRTNMEALKDRDPVLYREAQWTLDIQPMVYDILQESPDEKAAILKDIRKTARKSPKHSYMVDKLEKAIAEDNRMYNSDPLARADHTGLIVLEPMDMSSPESIVAGLPKRLKQALTVQGEQNAFKGFFTKEELPRLGNLLENAGVQEKLQIYGGIHEKLGEFAPVLYEQLKEFDIAGTAALAGQLYSRGPQFRTTAENILKGAELRRTDKLTQIKMKDNNTDLDNTIKNRMGLMFAGNKRHQSAMIEAFKDVWAVTENKDSAFKQLVGETFTFNGMPVQAPQPGVGSWAYESHIKDISPSWWASEEMRANGLTPEQLREFVIEGDLDLIGIGNDSYHLQNTKGEVVKKPDGKTPLVFSIDMTEPTAPSFVSKEVQRLREATTTRKQEIKEMERQRKLRTWNAIGGSDIVGDQP